MVGLDRHCWAVALLMVVLVIGLGHGAVVPKPNQRQVFTVKIRDNGLNETRKENITMELFQEAVDDYFDLSDAFYDPAYNETVREKRADSVFQRVAKRVRGGVRSLRKLFSGRRRGSGEDGGAPRGAGFRKFIGNLLNRILVFLTRLWDRITGLFRRNSGSGDGSGSDGDGEGESGGGVGSRIFKRIRTGAAALAKRLRGRGSGDGSSSGGLTGIFASLSQLNPKTTPEPYVVVDYSDSSNTVDDEDKGDIKVVDDEQEKVTEQSSTAVEADTSSDKISSVDTDVGTSSGGYSSDPTSFRSAVSDDFYSVTSDDSVPASSSNGWNARRFVPFPMDSDPNYHLDDVPSRTYYSSSPWVTSSRRVDTVPRYSYDA